MSVVSFNRERQKIWKRKLDATGYHDRIPEGIPPDFVLKYIRKRWPEPLSQEEVFRVMEDIRNRDE